MKKIIILTALLLIAVLLNGVALNSDDFNVVYPNLMWIDNSLYTGITGTHQKVCDAQGDPIGWAVSTVSIRMDTGYKLEWVGSDIFIYNDGSNSLTINGDDYVKLVGATEIDLTSPLVDINGLTTTITGTYITTGGIFAHTGVLSVSDDVTLSNDVDIDGMTNLDNVDIDGTVQIDNTTTIGASGTSFNVTMHSDIAGDNLLWDANAAELIVTGSNGSDAISVPDGDVTVTDDISGATITATTGFTGDLLGAVDLNAGKLILDADQDTHINALTDDQIDFYIGKASTPKYRIDISGIYPVATNTYACGILGNAWSEGHYEYIRTERLVATGGIAGSIDNCTLGGSTPKPATVTDFETEGDVVFNSALADVDLTIGTNTYNNTIKVEGSSDNVGIGDVTPDAKLHIHDTDAAAYITVLKVERTSGSPDDDDETRIGFFYTDDSAGQEEYARISLITDDVSDSNEKGSIQVSSMYRTGAEVGVADGVKLGSFGIALNGTPQTISGAGNITATQSVTQITTTGANAFTISAGLYEGQKKHIYHIVDGGAATIATGAGVTIMGTITLTNAGEGCILMWDDVNKQWICISINGTFAP